MCCILPWINGEQRLPPVLSKLRDSKNKLLREVVSVAIKKIEYG